MPASLSFKKDDKTTDATGLSDVRVVIYTDDDGNEYTLDTTGNLELNYKDHADNTKNYKIENLSGIVSRLIGSNTFKTAVLNDGTNPITTVDGLLTELTTGDSKNKKVYTERAVDDVFVKTEDLATKVADKDVVDVLVPALATVGTDDTKKVYTKAAAETAFVKTGDLATKVADKDVVDVLVPALATVGTDDTKKVYTKAAAETAFVKTGDLATKVAEQSVVDVLVPALATVGTDDTKKVYTKKNVDDALNLKADASALRDLVLEKGPSAQDVATQLLSTAKTKDDLGKAILGVTKEVDGTQQPALETDLAGNKILQDAVASNGTLKANLAKPADIAAVPALKTAVATQLLSDANKDQLGTAILGVTKKVDNVDKPVLETNLAASKTLQDAVAAVPALREAVATKLITDKAAELGTAVLGVTKKVNNVDKPALETNLAANTGLQTAVKNALAGDEPFTSDVRVAVNAEEIRKVMSQPVFEIPADPNAPLSWDW